MLNNKNSVFECIAFMEADFRHVKKMLVNLNYDIKSHYNGTKS